MNPVLIGIIICIVSLAILLCGMPIAFALGFSAILFSLIFKDVSQVCFTANILFDGMDNFGLLAIPLFILMGSIIASSPAGSDLYESIHRWLYRVPGGLAISNIIACAIFAALCGSSPATAAAIGTSGIPEMRKRGYPSTLATGAIVGGGTLGILIPPSITMIVYGIATETSIGKLFLAGFIPGLMLMFMFSAWALLFISWHRKKRRTEEELLSQALTSNEGDTLRDKLRYSVRVIPFIILIILILFSLYGGLATPSEAAAVGAIAALVIVAIIYRIFSLKSLAVILRMCIRESTMVLLIVATSFLFGSILSKLYVTQALANAIISLEINRWFLMILINIFLLVLGCFMPPVAIILIVSPILHPIITDLGWDAIWFGVIVTLNMEAGLITPPVGLNLFVVQGIARDVPMMDILKGSMPFIVMLIIGIIILCIFPGIAMWLPNQMIK